MIREIIHLTDSLMNDQYTLSILHRKMKPSKGLHVFIEIDSDGKWKNQPPLYDIDYAFYEKESEFSKFFSSCAQYEACGKRVGTTMNKVLCKKKQLFSCSPYIISFKKKSLTNDKLEGVGYQKIANLLPYYFNNAQNTCLRNADETFKQLSKAFEQVCYEVLQQLTVFTLSQMQKDGSIVQFPIVETMEDEGYINLYLKNIPLQNYREAHESYLQEKLFNDNTYNNETVITNNTYGLSNFLNGLNAKKPFLEHKTAMLHKGISGRIQLKDAFALNKFEILLSNKMLPNPLPIIVDERETNHKIVDLFNSEEKPMPYRELLIKLFDETNRDYLSNFYLIHSTKTKEKLKINDFDFVSLFRFNLEKNTRIYNITQIKEKNSETDQDIKLITVFDFERIVVKEIFNNSLVKIKPGTYTANYFGEVDPAYVSGGDVMYQQIKKYRKAIYDYIYKSKRNAINSSMFDDMMYHSILSNIRTDEIKGRFEWNNTIKKKLNIWFSLHNLFNNNLKENDMDKQTLDLMPKMSCVVKGEANFETPEEFAFGAGQLVFYLINLSLAANKTFEMLEPYLQKNKSRQLQDTIVKTIAIYKHAISLYHGKFKWLAMRVLTYSGDVEMKPLMKYFLAGCFSPCVIYESDKNKETNN